jgi:translation initiation factor IF-1
MKQESLAFEGIVLQELGNSMFRVELDMAGSHEITCTISGKIRKNFIKILAGDRVLVEMSPYDLTKGRIERRLSDRGDAELINNSKTSKKKKK